MERMLPLRRYWRMALCSLGMAFTASPVLAQVDESHEQTTFAGHFVGYDIPPESYEPVEDAVDLSQFEPPIEAPPIAQFLGEGTASYYGRKFNGRRTASGETFDMAAFTAAHRTLPFGSKVRVTNLANEKSVVVRINDRGPFTRKRVIDLSRAAAEEIGLIRRGHGKVRLELVEE